LYLFFLSFGVHSQSCTYTSNGNTLTMSNIPVLSWTDTATSFTYSWTPCTNGYSCGTNGNIMAGQLNTKNGNCNKLAVWDSTVKGTYTATNKTWTITFNNGAACGTNNAPRITILYLKCGTGSNQLTSVTNPSGACTYDYYALGSGFCGSSGGTTGSPNGGGSSGGKGGLSGGWVFIIILLVVIFLYCTIGLIYNKKKVNPDSSWGDVNNVPNIGFWRSLPKWTWAGCCVTKDWIASKMNRGGDTHQPIASETS